MRPDTSKGFEVYVDCDFVGLYEPYQTHDRNNFRSRKGILLTFYGVPITWISKLQTTIALSTTEAEFLALSDASR